MMEMARRAVELVVGEGRRPGDDEDLLDTGAVDSMGWVGILSELENQAGVSNLGAVWPAGKPRSIRVLAELLSRSRPAPQELTGAGSLLTIGVRGWGAALGSEQRPGATLDADYGLASGVIGSRTGIESVVRAAPGETEVSLAQAACRQALLTARTELDDVDLLVAASETFLGFPSLAAALHSALLLPERCWALDVGGGCLGLMNALAAARAVLAAGAGRHALVVAADVHSRRFAGTSAPWQLAALFGDAAGAVVLDAAAGAPYFLGDFRFGCAGAFASALRIAPAAGGDLAVEFQGAQLADAAIGHLARLIQAHPDADGFAIHEPNPRAVEILARRCGIPLEKFTQLSRTCGNLGSATCAVALSRLLERKPPPRRIVLASLGPGLLWSAASVGRLP